MINEVNQLIPCQKKTNYLPIYIINMIFIIFMSIASVFYFIVVISYIKKNISNKNLLTYWFDYIIINLTLLILLILYLTQQIQYIIAEQINNKCYLCNDNIYICNALYYSSVVLILLCTNNLIYNTIKGFILLSTLNKVSILSNKITDESLKKLKVINIKSVIDKKYHITELILTTIVFIVILISYLVIDNIESFKGNIAFFKWLFVSFKISYLIICILLLVMVVSLRHSKQNAFRNTFYSNDIQIQIIFNVTNSKLAFLCDFFAYKITIDCIGNIPVLLYLSLEKMNISHMIICYIALFIYSFYSTIMFVYVDKLHKTKKSPLMKKIFCLKRFNMHFGVKKQKFLFEELDFNYSKKEIKTFSDFNVTLSSKDNYVNSLFPNSTENNNNIIYFILFKILYLFFQTNEQIYTATQKTMEEEGTAFMTFNNTNTNINGISNNKNKNNVMIKNNNKDYLRDNLFDPFNRKSRIRNMSILPKFNDLQLKSFIKFNQSSLINTIEDKEYFREFKHEYEACINNPYETNIEFEIESLFNSNLFPLFPFYQLTVQDILRSLDPSNNKELFSLFTDNVERNSAYNEFYTKDSFLSLEIYDKGFLAYDKLKEFFNSYQSYLLDIIKKMNYTYLPLIIGIYHISFLNFNKIVVLYRHQLSFSPFVKFNNWIKFLITETMEEIAVSQKYNDVIDVNEIEIKNNIKLNIEEYNEVERNIINDLHFIKKLPFKPFPQLHLFVGNQISNQCMSLNVSANDSTQIGKDDFDNVLRDSEYFGDNNRSQAKLLIKEFGSQIGSLFEKEYEVKGNEGRFVIKIYFTLLFKETCSMNIRERKLKNKIDSGYYCDQYAF